MVLLTMSKECDGEDVCVMVRTTSNKLKMVKMKLINKEGRLKMLKLEFRRRGQDEQRAEEDDGLTLFGRAGDLPKQSSSTKKGADLVREAVNLHKEK